MAQIEARRQVIQRDITLPQRRAAETIPDLDPAHAPEPTVGIYGSQLSYWSFIFGSSSSFG